MSWPLIIALVVIGLCSGCITGFIGASGVLVVVPTLNMLLGLPVHTAIGASLAIDVIASVATSSVYCRRLNVELRSGIWLALGRCLERRLVAGWQHTYPKFEFRWNSALEVLGPMREVDLCVELKRVVASFAVGFSRRNCKRSVQCRGGVMPPQVSYS
jgi:hypothetical protein